MTDEAPHMLVEQDGAILIATLNRPEKLNALSRETMEIFESAVLRFRDTPELKVMLIRATGRYFSAGADLRQGSAPPDYSRGSIIRETHRLKLNGMQRIYDEMEHIEKPFVVAHQGTCVGGGLEMSLSCDFRLAAESAKYSFPESKFGSLPASNGVSRLTRIVGTHWARYLVMGNCIADARKAEIMGLVHEVWPDEGFQERALEFCHHLCRNDAEQMGVAKLAIELCKDVGLEQARHVERMANSTLMMAPQFMENMKRHLTTVGGKK
jgi:enoyl-CoA hydratase/carnithine racemase